MWMRIWKAHGRREEEIAMTNEMKRNWAVCQLQFKAKELGRLPKKSDFDDATTSRIKAFLGPWPRALETAGLSKKRK